MKTKSDIIHVNSKYILRNKDVTGESKFVYYYDELEGKMLFAKDVHMAQEFSLDDARNLVVEYKHLQLSATLSSRI